MNQHRGVIIEVSVGEYVDRWVIGRVRAEKLNNSAEAWRVDQPIDGVSLEDILYAQADLLAQLHTIHQELWDLECRIRSDGIDPEFCALARRILTLNDERHRIKAEIDSRLPTRCASKRSYGETPS